MISLFLTDLDTRMRGERIHILLSPLVYHSGLLNRSIIIPAGFETDLASVPRLPIIYALWGDRAHREAVLHDYLYRIDSDPVVSKDVVDKVFLEAMQSRGAAWWIRYPMYYGVCAGGIGSYHKRRVTSSI